MRLPRPCQCNRRTGSARPLASSPWGLRGSGSKPACAGLDCTKEPPPLAAALTHTAQEVLLYQFQPMCSGRYTTMPTTMVPRMPRRQK